MTLANHMEIFDYEDLSFRKEFGKRLFLLGLRRGEAIIRLADDDVLTPKRMYYLGLCDEIRIKTGPRTTLKVYDKTLKILLSRLSFKVGLNVRRAIVDSGKGLFDLGRLEDGDRNLNRNRSEARNSEESTGKAGRGKESVAGWPALHKPLREAVA